MPDNSFEIALAARYPGPIAGVDEVGRGPLAGPVVAAAVILQPTAPPSLLGRIDDSKRLKPAVRDELAEEIACYCPFAIGAASTAEIDRINILQATYLAMRRALARLSVRPSAALIDGNRLPPDLSCPAETVVKGDSRSLSIAAASIVAKTVRDRAMRRLDLRYPGYGWEHNVGYGTAEHRTAILAQGPTPHHRTSFEPVRSLVSQSDH